MRLKVKNFLGLREVDWSPAGVCLVAGPNGSGKTSLLEAIVFLNDLSRRTVPDAVRRLGIQAFKHASAPTTEPVFFSIEATLLGESDPVECRWEIEIDVSGGGLQDFPAERLWINQKLVLQRVALSAKWSAGEQTIEDEPDELRRTCLRAARERRLLPEADPFVRFLESSRVCYPWTLAQFREIAAMPETEDHLLPGGRNLFGVLNRWRGAPRRYRDQFEWVRQKAREAFFDIFDDLEVTVAEGILVPRFFPPDFPNASGLPILRAPDGLLTGLLHLTAVAGARNGSVIALDEMENQLHPHAIRVILAAMRELADERDLTILLTSHSPVVMNEFRHDMDSFFVMERATTPTPRPITELHDSGWLAQFSLGGLYETLRFGQPHPPA